MKEFTTPKQGKCMSTKTSFWSYILLVNGASVLYTFKLWCIQPQFKMKRLFTNAFLDQSDICNSFETFENWRQSRIRHGHVLYPEYVCRSQVSRWWPSCWFVRETASGSGWTLKN